MTLPVPTPGLIINYSYLWWSEHRSGLNDGLKDRPCVIVAIREVEAGLRVATVVPVTHSLPREPGDAIEIPPLLKSHLGLDGERSFIAITETNDFVWPGPDLRPVSRQKTGVFHFGILPPRFFAHVRDRLLQTNAERRLKHVTRDE